MLEEILTHINFNLINTENIIDKHIKKSIYDGMYNPTIRVGNTKVVFVFDELDYVLKFWYNENPQINHTISTRFYLNELKGTNYDNIILAPDLFLEYKGVGIEVQKKCNIIPFEIPNENLNAILTECYGQEFIDFCNFMSKKYSINNDYLCTKNVGFLNSKLVIFDMI